MLETLNRLPHSFELCLALFIYVRFYFRFGNISQPVGIPCFEHVRDVQEKGCEQLPEVTEGGHDSTFKVESRDNLLWGEAQHKTGNA